MEDQNQSQLSSSRKRARSSADNTDTGTCSKTQTEDSNGETAATLGEKGTPHFKVIWDEKKYFDISALQRTELINGKPQDPIVVSQVPLPESFKPGELPAQLKTGQEWLTLHQLLKDVLSMKAEDIHTGAYYWILDGVQPEACKPSEMIKKHGGRIPDNWCDHACCILRAFIHRPSLSNTVGRDAAFHLLALCKDIACKWDPKKWDQVGIYNVGGGALGYEGSCTFAKFFAPTNCEDEAKYLASEKCEIQRKAKGQIRYKTKVPDGQVYTLHEDGKSCARFDLTVDVKPGKLTKEDNQQDTSRKRKREKKSETEKASKSETDAEIQTWKQALVSLAKSDISYGVLINPTYARMFELKIENKYLITSTKTFTFLTSEVNGNLFNSQSMLDLMEAIVYVMLNKCGVA